MGAVYVRRCSAPSRQRQRNQKGVSLCGVVRYSTTNTLRGTRCIYGYIHVCILLRSYIYTRTYRNMTTPNSRSLPATRDRRQETGDPPGPRPIVCSIRMLDTTEQHTVYSTLCTEYYCFTQPQQHEPTASGTRWAQWRPVGTAGPSTGRLTGTMTFSVWERRADRTQPQSDPTPSPNGGALAAPS